LNEFDGKVLGVKISHGFLSTLGVARSHQDEDAFGRKLPRDFLSDSFVGAGYECDGISHGVI